MIFTVSLPVGPSVNAMYVKAHRNSRFGSKAPSPQFVAWTKLAKPIIQQAWKDQEQPVITRPWGCNIRLGINHQSDIANREKAIVDLIVKTVAVPDDAWMDRLVIERGGAEGMAEIEIYSLPR